MNKILTLILAVVGLAATVFVVGKQTGLINFAHDYSPIAEFQPKTLNIVEIGTVIKVTPKCQVRPPCLDAKPACKIAMPADGWCSKAEQNSYILRTADKRELVLKPVGNLSFTKSIDQLVLVEGSISKSVTTKCTETGSVKKCTQDKVSWWPIKSGEVLTVKNIITVLNPVSNATQSQMWSEGVLKLATKNYQNENVYQIVDGTYLYSSSMDLSSFEGKRIQYQLTGAPGYQLVNRDIFFNLDSSKIKLATKPTTYPVPSIIVSPASQCKTDKDCNYCPPGKACPAVVRSCVNGACVTK